MLGRNEKNIPNKSSDEECSREENSEKECSEEESSDEECSDEECSENVVLLGEMDLAMINDGDRTAAYLFGISAALTRCRRGRGGEKVEKGVKGERRGEHIDIPPRCMKMCTLSSLSFP